MACKYKPAQMIRRVTLQSVTTTTDAQGGSTETWEDETDLWAQIQPLKGWERMQAMQLQTPITHKVTLRYRTGLTTAMRLKFNDRILAIKEIINIDEANTYLVLQCIET